MLLPTDLRKNIYTKLFLSFSCPFIFLNNTQAGFRKSLLIALTDSFKLPRHTTWTPSQSTSIYCCCKCMVILHEVACHLYSRGILCEVALHLQCRGMLCKVAFQM